MNKIQEFLVKILFAVSYTAIFITYIPYSLVLSIIFYLRDISGEIIDFLSIIKNIFFGDEIYHDPEEEEI